MTGYRRQGPTPAGAGDEQPFLETLAVRYRGALNRFFERRAARLGDTEDLTQEVFLRLYAALKRDEPIQNRRAWVIRVAHNLGLRLRAQQSSRARFELDVEMELADPELNPEQSLLERERLLCFHRAVESLSEQQRRCLHLRLEGLRYPEIAAVLGISASAVGEFLRRAIVRLRKVSHE